MQTLPEFCFCVALTDDKKNPNLANWSGDNPPPAVGDTIRDARGEAFVVKSYFTVEGWLGVMALNDAGEQQDFFGAEIY